MLVGLIENNVYQILPIKQTKRIIINDVRISNKKNREIPYLNAGFKAKLTNVIIICTQNFYPEGENFQQQKKNWLKFNYK